MTIELRVAPGREGDGVPRRAGDGAGHFVDHEVIALKATGHCPVCGIGLDGQGVPGFAPRGQRVARAVGAVGEDLGGLRL
jgi:hypothetical protein